jgi:hypothetical protein
MKKKQKTERPQYFIREDVERPVLKREYFRVSKERATEDLILRSQLTKLKTLTIAQINELVRAKVLTPTTYRSEVYFQKEDVLKGIKYLSTPPKLF